MFLIALRGSWPRLFPRRRYILKCCNTCRTRRRPETQDPHHTMSTQTIAVHLPDGAIREVPAGTTSRNRQLDLASTGSRCGRCAAHSSGGHCDPGLYLNWRSSLRSGHVRRRKCRCSAIGRSVLAPLTADTRLELVTEKDPEALKVVRHSAAHVHGDGLSSSCFLRPSLVTGRPPTPASSTTSIAKSLSRRKISR